MRLGKDVLAADLYGALGVLPDATESEIRVAYRQQVRTSHPDLNQADPDAPLRMLRLNAASRVLLDPALRRVYDREHGRAAREAGAQAPAPRSTAWYERREQGSGDDWTHVPASAARHERSRCSGFFRELRGRDGHVTLQLQELIDSLSGRQQLGITALLCAVAISLIVMARPHVLDSDAVQPTTGSVDSVYP
jgi:DnaJ-class molecular chaperone